MAGECPIETVAQFKYLGVTQDQYLDFSVNVNQIQSKTLGKIQLLGKARSFVHHDTSIMLYETLILPLFDYCDYVYHCLTRRDCNTLKKMQNCRLRRILRCERFTPVSYVHQECGVRCWLIDAHDMFVMNSIKRRILFHQ